MKHKIAYNIRALIDYMNEKGIKKDDVVTILSENGTYTLIYEQDKE